MVRADFIIRRYKLLRIFHFIDGYSKRYWVYPIKRKVDMFAIFKILKNSWSLNLKRRSSFYRLTIEENIPMMNLIALVNKKISRDSSQ